MVETVEIDLPAQLFANLLQNVLIPIGADFVHSELSPFTFYKDHQLLTHAITPHARGHVVP